MSLDKFSAMTRHLDLILSQDMLNSASVMISNTKTLSQSRKNLLTGLNKEIRKSSKPRKLRKVNRLQRVTQRLSLRPLITKRSLMLRRQLLPKKLLKGLRRKKLRERNFRQILMLRIDQSMILRLLPTRTLISRKWKDWLQSKLQKQLQKRLRMQLKQQHKLMI
jgi:hypothetical protein